jgi:serine/threonine protein kinase
MGTAPTSGAAIAGRYRLQKQLGHGGMGSVWEATHLVTRRLVAIKFLRATLAGRPEMHRRFLREARAAAAVDHPNVVEIYDVFELEDATPVMVMALLRGETFGRRLARETTLSLEDTLGVLLPVISAVGTAHALGIVHRDLKPENIFLAREEKSTVVKVLDFGIAKLSTGDEMLDSVFTVTGTMLGTPHYMAPEQGFGEKDVDHRADIWSIGAMLYEALTGGRPVEGNNLGQVLKRFLTSGITPISALVPDLPEEVASLVMRMLARERSERPADLREVHAVLTKYGGISTREFGAPRVESPSVSPAPTPTPVVSSVVTHGDTMESERSPLDTGGAHSISIMALRSRKLTFTIAGTAGIVLAVLLVLGSLRRPSVVEQPATVALADSQVQSRPSVAAPSVTPVAATTVAAEARSAAPTAPASATTDHPPIRASTKSTFGAPPTASAIASKKAIAAIPSANPTPQRAPNGGLYEEPPF